MKKNLLQLILVALMTLLIPATAKPQTHRTDFTGDWVLNESKSDNSKAPVTKFSVKQDATTLIQTMTREYKGQISTFTTKIYFDGRADINTRGYHEYSTTVSWSADGKTMTVETQDTYTGENVQEGTSGGGGIRFEWTLADPKTLLLTSYNGDAPGMKYVYDKK